MFPQIQTQASKAVEEYNTRTSNKTFLMCANKVSNKKVTRQRYGIDVWIYRFPDGSIAETRGRTVNFTMREIQEQELANIIAVENLFSEFRKPLI